MKKLLILGVCSLLAATSLVYSAPAEAAYYFVSSCGNPNPRLCPGGPAPVWFGPFSSWGECDAAWDIINNGIFGTYPWSLSNCYEE